jgi:tetratricopeptide (TPR) repeat protein
VIALECATGENERTALEAALAKEPKNAEILARLCRVNRTTDPTQAIEYCRRALEIQPRDVNYGTSYAAALVQARRFVDAVTVLRRVIEVAPDKFVAHANLAISLFELKMFPEALIEYKWILAAKPETTAAYFFIGIIHDKMGEYSEALIAYQDFLARADAVLFKLEIDKVNLRLPSLRNQIKQGKGVKKKS